MSDHKQHDRLMRFIGLAGVDTRENDTAQRWGRALEWPLLIFAFWILIDWYHKTADVEGVGFIPLSDWTVWSFFAAELTLMLWLVDRPVRYLKQNWLSLVIVLVGIPLTIQAVEFNSGILRSLRLLLFFGILFRLSADLRSVLGRHNLGITLMVAFGFLVLAAFLISGLDPAFENPVDGFWWAWVTMTTVGYGDLVPTTLEGRIVGMLLILVGIAIFSLLTASFSVFFIEKGEREMVDREQATLLKIQLLEARLERIESQLHTAVSALQRMETLEAEKRAPKQHPPAGSDPT